MLQIPSYLISSLLINLAIIFEDISNFKKQGHLKKIKLEIGIIKLSPKNIYLNNKTT